MTCFAAAGLTSSVLNRAAGRGGNIGLGIAAGAGGAFGAGSAVYARVVLGAISAGNQTNAKVSGDSAAGQAVNKSNELTRTAQSIVDRNAPAEIIPGEHCSGNCTSFGEHVQKQVKALTVKNITDTATAGIGNLFRKLGTTVTTLFVPLGDNQFYGIVYGSAGGAIYGFSRCLQPCALAGGLIFGTIGNEIGKRLDANSGEAE